MATLAGTHTTSTIVGKAESVADALYDISVSDKPFLQLVGDTNKAGGNTFHSWNIDKLREAKDNAKPEGNKYDFSTKQQPVESGNHYQIADETFSVAGTTEAVKLYGRAKDRGGEIKRLKKKTAKELMLDVERVMVGQIGGSDDAGGVRRCSSFGAFLTSNADRGTGGADGGYDSGTKKVAAPTDGTLRTFTETILVNAQQSAFQNGGNPNILMLPTALKRTFSGFPGLGEKRQNYDGLELGGSSRRKVANVAAVDIYIGDFGTVASVVNRHQRARDAYLIDPNYVSVDYLRKLKTTRLAKQADSEDFALNVEFTLINKNEAAHAGMHDLQPA